MYRADTVDRVIGQLALMSGSIVTHGEGMRALSLARTMLQDYCRACEISEDHARRERETEIARAAAQEQWLENERTVDARIEEEATAKAKELIRDLGKIQKNAKRRIERRQQRAENARRRKAQKGAKRV